MTTDKRSVLPIRKEVRATRCVLLLAIVVALLLIAAAPASAFNGYRADYLTAADCQVCHPDTHAKWAETEHASVEGNHIPIHDGPRCAGCHAGNYDPQKAVPLSGSGTRPDPYLYPTDVAADGGAFSEAMVGCSTCHYGDAASTQHTAPASALANADICGQCHAVNGSSKPPNDTYPLASPTPGGVMNPSYPVGYNPLGTPEACGCGGWLDALPLTDVLNIPTPDVPINQNYYQIPGETPTTLMWAAATHTCCTVTGSGLQYEEWALEGHADALKSLKAVVGPNPPAKCLKCHSQDFRMAPDDAKPTGAETKYGVTCTSCHDPHEESAQGSVWNEDRDPQLTATRGTLCVECHQAELGWTAAKAGSTVHHPMREMMNGSGGVGVTRGKPSVHRGQCVQCHMPPTGWDRHGLVSATGANHTFTIIEPTIADQALTTKPLGDAGTQLGMPYSACTTCHGRPNDRPAMWLQGTIDARQKAIRGLSTKVRVALEVAARHLHYKSATAANVAINKKPVTRWTKDQMAFQRAFTNRSFVVSEGSWGIHNYSYARAVITKSLAQARSVYR